MTIYTTEQGVAIKKEQGSSSILIGSNYQYLLISEKSKVQNNVFSIFIPIIKRRKEISAFTYTGIFLGGYRGTFNTSCL